MNTLNDDELLFKIQTEINPHISLDEIEFQINGPAVKEFFNRNLKEGKVTVDKINSIIQNYKKPFILSTNYKEKSFRINLITSSSNA